MSDVKKYAKHQRSNDGFDFELNRATATLKALNPKALAVMKEHTDPPEALHIDTIEINPAPESMDALQAEVEGDGFKVRVLGTANVPTAVAAD